MAKLKLPYQVKRKIDMKYFSISELCKSTTAEAYHIDNAPGPQVVDNLEDLVNLCLDPIREAWGKPLKVNSGYRCKELNDRVKGSKTSHHLTGCAADITTGTKTNNKKLFNMIAGMQKNGIVQFTQLIDEYGYQWIHVSYVKNNLKNQILHLK